MLSYELNPQELQDHGYVSKGGKVNTFKVAERLKGGITENYGFSFLTIPLGDKDMLYVYDKGVYVLLSPRPILV